jgi:hypothetical protein
MMMGADYYQTEAERLSELSVGKVPVGVGENTKIRLLSLSILMCLPKYYACFIDVEFCHTGTVSLIKMLELGRM